MAHPLIATLPHRPPMVLVDDITDLYPGDRITTVKHIDPIEICYRDANPLAPYPVTLLLESFVQSAALLWFGSDPVHPGEQLLFAGITNADIGAPPIPGQTIVHHVKLLACIGSNAFFTGHCEVPGSPTALTVERVALARRPLA